VVLYGNTKIIKKNLVKSSGLDSQTAIYIKEIIIWKETHQKSLGV